MLDAWIQLPWWLRLFVAVGLIVGGGLVFWFASIRLGCGLVAIGFVLFVMGGPTRGEKSGYKF